MKTQSKIQLAMLVLLMIAIPCSAYGADGQIKIGQTSSTTFPIYINQSGSYVLTSNLIVPSEASQGIYIVASNVTLDLNGHSIIGPGSGVSKGIQISNGYNVTVTNGVVTNFGHDGITSSSAYTEIRGIKAYNNGYRGIKVGGPALITNCVASDNSNTGIDAHNSTITNSIALANGKNGINANVSTVTNCTISFNDEDGIDAYQGTITDCTFRYNKDDGIVAQFSTINNCTIVRNQGIGIDAQSSLINNCNISANATDGVYANGCTITNCSIISNNSNNIHAHSDNRIEGNNLRGAVNYGLLIESSSNYIIKNTASSNATNFQDNGSNNYMPICGVDVTDNCNYGW